MSFKPLSEVYAGSLSRNWPKLLDALDAGEERIHIYAENKYMFGKIGIATRCEEYHYHICNADHVSFVRQGIIDLLEKECKGFFPANDDEK